MRVWQNAIDRTSQLLWCSEYKYLHSIRKTTQIEHSMYQTIILYSVEVVSSIQKDDRVRNDIRGSPHSYFPYFVQ